MMLLRGHAANSLPRRNAWKTVDFSAPHERPGYTQVHTLVEGLCRQARRLLFVTSPPRRDASERRDGEPGQMVERCAWDIGDGG